MESITFTPGNVHLQSRSVVDPWGVRFEDEGTSAYLYACDLSQHFEEDLILDAMLVYNVSALEARERIASVQWSRDGMQAAFYIDGVPQAFADFATRRSFCRLNFPNFVAGSGDRWQSSAHAWDENAIVQFEAGLLE